MRNKRNKKILLVLIALLLLCLQVTPVMAEQGVKNWGSKRTTDIKKTWTVTFSSPVDKNTIKGSNVYVMDEKNKKVAVKLTLSSNNTKVSLTPVNAYAAGKSYRLFVTAAVAAQNKKVLTQKIIMPFTVEPPAKEVTTSAITSVKIDNATYVTVVRVSAADTVASVKCDGNKMHYLGKHVYELGIAGAKPGQALTISAYDASGKLIISEKHQVK